MDTCSEHLSIVKPDHSGLFSVLICLSELFFKDVFCMDFMKENALHISALHEHLTKM